MPFVDIPPMHYQYNLQTGYVQSELTYTFLETHWAMKSLPCFNTHPYLVSPVRHILLTA